MVVNSSETSFQQWFQLACSIYNNNNGLILFVISLTYPDVRIDVPVRYEQTFNNYNIVLLWLRIEHTMIHTLENYNILRGRTTELYYIWRKHANLSSVKQLKPKHGGFLMNLTSFSPYPWQRLMLAPASQAQF